MDSSLRSRVRLLLLVGRSDLILIGGGGLLNDRQEGIYRPFTRVAAACRLLHKPYAFVAVGAGPVRRAATKRAIRAACENALEASVQDEQSRVELIDLGVRRTILVTPDPALQIAVELGPKTFDLCINLRSWGLAQEPSTIVTTHDVCASLAEVLNGLSPRPTVALLSMSYEYDPDDAPLRELAKLLDFPTQTLFHPTVDQALDVIGRSHRVVAMRLHACLLATAAGIPAVGIAYDRKVRNQAQLHGFSSLSMEDATSPSLLLEQVAADDNDMDLG